MVAFNAIAQLHLDGRASAYWVMQTVVEVAEPHFPRSITNLPLGALYLLEDEWGAGWGRTEAQLRDVVRKACLTQLERPRVASQLARAEPARPLPPHLSLLKENEYRGFDYGGLPLQVSVLRKRYRSSPVGACTSNPGLA